MKSPKQRRQEIKARRLWRAERKARAVAARPVDRPVGTVVVTPALLRPTTGYGIPEFVQRGYYQDRPFRCKDCGMEEVWTAVQQRWWREVARGDVWTVAVCCRPCRQREPGTEDRSAAGPFGGTGGEAGALAMSAAGSGRERWICGLHALAGGLLALPTLGLIGDWLSGAPEAFLSFLAMMLWFSLGSLLPFLAVGWAALAGYWWWTGDARRRRFLVAWYASAVLTLAPFWPPSSINAVTLLLSLVGILLTALVLPSGYWR